MNAMSPELERELNRIGVLSIKAPPQKPIRDNEFKDPRDANGEVPF